MQFFPFPPLLSNLCLRCHLILNLGCLYSIANEPSAKYQPPLGRQEAPALPGTLRLHVGLKEPAKLQPCSSAASQGSECQPEVIQVLLGQFGSSRLLCLPSAAPPPPPPPAFNLLLVSFSLRTGPVGCQSVMPAAAAF